MLYHSSDWKAGDVISLGFSQYSNLIVHGPQELNPELSPFFLSFPALFHYSFLTVQSDSLPLSLSNCHINQWAKMVLVVQSSLRVHRLSLSHSLTASHALLTLSILPCVSLTIREWSNCTRGSPNFCSFSVESPEKVANPLMSLYGLAYCFDFARYLDSLPLSFTLTNRQFSSFFPYQASRHLSSILINS